MDSVNVLSPQGKFRPIPQIWHLVKISILRGGDEQRKGLHGEKRGKRGTRRKLKRKRQLAPGGYTTKMHRTKWIYKPLTYMMYIRVRLRKLNAGGRWNTKEYFPLRTSRPWLTILQNHSFFLPLGPQKHLTLLTSLPERARVWGRWGDSKMREKDETGCNRNVAWNRAKNKPVLCYIILDLARL